jgi:hypothetical protein
LIKKGVISAYKVGGQYRILGREILSLFNPRVQAQAVTAFRKVKNGVKKKLEMVD